MTTVIAILLAAAVALVVYNDAKRLLSRGVQVAGIAPHWWFWFAFMMLIIAGPLYLYKRRQALGGGGVGRSRRGGESSPAGWHPDPDNPRQLRWWDGTKWTDETTSFDPPPPPDGS